MHVVRVVCPSWCLAAVALLSASAAPPDETIEVRKPIPAEVKKAAADYADTIVDAIRILHEDHIKKVSRAELVGWAIEGLYKRMGTRVPDEIVKRLLDLRDPKEADLRALLIEARQHLGKHARLSEFRDMDKSLAGIFERLEPGNIPRPLRGQRIGCLLGGYVDKCGIGADVRADKISGMLRVVTPLKESAAYEAGLRAGDIIARITQEKDGEDGSRPWSISTKGMTTEQAEKRLLGPIGSKVKLTVYRDDPSKPKEVAIVRKWSSKEMIFGVRRKADASWDFLCDRSARIAYIRIAEFTRRTQPELKRALAKLRQRRIKGLILDLRGNPGGLFDGALESAAMFLGKGSLLTTVRHGSGKEYRFASEKRGRRRPRLVCLIDGGTARASEILAACLQDHHRAIILGERSRGEVGVRTIHVFRDRWLAFTTAVFHRPNGKPLNKIVASGKGEDDGCVHPDKGFAVKLAPVERKGLAEHLRNQEIIAPFNRPLEANKPPFRDRQLEKALDYLRKSTREVNS